MTQKELIGDDWIPEEEMAKLRNKTSGTLKKERCLGGGPPWTKDGRMILYSRIGYREWLEKKSVSDNKTPQPRRRR